MTNLNRTEKSGNIFVYVLKYELESLKRENKKNKKDRCAGKMDDLSLVRGFLKPSHRTNHFLPFLYRFGPL